MASEQLREEAMEFLQKHPYTVRVMSSGDEHTREIIEKIKAIAAEVE